jgi:hypothetical protein
MRQEEPFQRRVGVVRSFTGDLFSSSGVPRAARVLFHHSPSQSDATVRATSPLPSIPSRMASEQVREAV